LATRRAGKDTPPRQPVRFSSDGQQTIPLQMRALREYAVRRGWAVSTLVREIGAGVSVREHRERNELSLHGRNC
jgi:hypothetical protein